MYTHHVPGPMARRMILLSPQCQPPLPAFSPPPRTQSMAPVFKPFDRVYGILPKLQASQSCCRGLVLALSELNTGVPLMGIRYPSRILCSVVLVVGCTGGGKPASLFCGSRYPKPCQCSTYSPPVPSAMRRYSQTNLTFGCTSTVPLTSLSGSGMSCAL